MATISGPINTKQRSTKNKATKRRFLINFRLIRVPILSKFRIYFGSTCRLLSDKERPSVIHVCCRPGMGEIITLIISSREFGRRGSVKMCANLIWQIFKRRRLLLTNVMSFVCCCRSDSGPENGMTINLIALLAAFSFPQITEADLSLTCYKWAGHISPLPELDTNRGLPNSVCSSDKNITIKRGHGMNEMRKHNYTVSRPLYHVNVITNSFLLPGLGQETENKNPKSRRMTDTPRK